MNANPRLLRLVLAGSGLLVAASLDARADTIGFEGFAPSGSFVYVQPGTPYVESGFTFTPSTTNEAGIFDSASAYSLAGDGTDYFGFNENNVITMTFGGGSFSLASLLLGAMNPPNTATSGSIVGNLSGGGSVAYNFNSLLAATPINLNWSNLSSVVFRVTSDTGIDNLLVGTSVPEPGTLALLGLGLAGLGLSRRRKAN